MRVLPLLLLILNILGLVSALYVARSSESQDPMVRLRRSGLLFGKLARHWAADDKRVVLRPLVEYEPDPFY